MAKEIVFKRGDGTEFTVEEGSAAFELMSADGSFRRLDEEGEPVGDQKEDLTKLTVKQLQEKAALLDVPITKEMKKAEIIAAIEEKVKVPTEE